MATSKSQHKKWIFLKNPYIYIHTYSIYSRMIIYIYALVSGLEHEYYFSIYSE